VLLALAARRESAEVKAEFANWVPERMPVFVAVLLALAGLAALVGGAYLTAAELTRTANHLRAPSFVIGDTMAAFATALPAAAVAVIAARRGRSDLVLGVAVGPVIFNLLFTAAAAAMAQPLLIHPRVICQVIR
jgi:cation:H+ antiporter